MKDDKQIIKELTDVICSVTEVKFTEKRVWIEVDRAAWEKFVEREEHDN